MRETPKEKVKSENMAAQNRKSKMEEKIAHRNKIFRANRREKFWFA